jgi:hypothetical protein
MLEFGIGLANSIAGCQEIHWLDSFCVQCDWDKSVLEYLIKRVWRCSCRYKEALGANMSPLNDSEKLHLLLSGHFCVLYVIN